MMMCHTCCIREREFYQITLQLSVLRTVHFKVVSHLVFNYKRPPFTLTLIEIFRVERVSVVYTTGIF